MDTLNPLDKEFFEFFKLFGRAYGLKDLTLHIMAILYMEPEEISMEDISKKTGYSLASISNSMKVLVNGGQVQQIRKPGSKKVFFFMEKDLIKLNISKIYAAYENFVKPGDHILQCILAKYTHVKDEHQKKKIEIIRNYHKQFVKFGTVLQKWKRDLEAML